MHTPMKKIILKIYLYFNIFNINIFSFLFQYRKEEITRLYDEIHLYHI
jgi:hypothetical protein